MAAVFESKREMENKVLVAKVTEMFTFFDTSQSGLIALDDLGPFLRAIGFNPTEREINELQDQLLGDDENVDFNMILEVVENFERHQESYEDLLEAFKLLDSNSTGYVVANDLKELVMNHGEPLTEEEANEMLARAEVDVRGKIKYINFAGKLSKEVG